MKKVLYMMVGALMAFSAYSAKADFYAGAGYGLSFNGGSAMLDGKRDGYKNSSAYGIFGGYEWALPAFDVRGDLEYLRTRPGVKGQPSRRLDAMMASASVVIPFVPMFDPYVGLGWGYVRYDHTNTTAWQYQMGVDYKFTTIPVAIGAEYRYLKPTETCGKAANTSKYHGSIVMLKARYLF